MNHRLLPSFAVWIVVSLPAAAQAPAPPPDSNAEALKILRQTIADQTRNPDKIIRAPLDEAPATKPSPPPVTPRAAAAAELEQRYLAGKLSARDYEKALARLRLQSQGVTNAIAGSASTGGQPKAGSGRTPASEPTVASPKGQPTERQKKISEVESRLDDMIRAKEARERSAQTNEIKATPGQKQTKRERLDFLLRQVVQGKLSDEEYKKERERILAEPD